MSKPVVNPNQEKITEFLTLIYKYGYKPADPLKMSEIIDSIIEGNQQPFTDLEKLKNNETGINLTDKSNDELLLDFRKQLSIGLNNLSNIVRSATDAKEFHDEIRSLKEKLGIRQDYKRVEAATAKRDAAIAKIAKIGDDDQAYDLLKEEIALYSVTIVNAREASEIIDPTIDVEKFDSKYLGEITKNLNRVDFKAKALKLKGEDKKKFTDEFNELKTLIDTYRDKIANYNKQKKEYDKMLADLGIVRRGEKIVKKAKAEVIEEAVVEETAEIEETKEEVVEEETLEETKEEIVQEAVTGELKAVELAE